MNVNMRTQKLSPSGTQFINSQVPIENHRFSHACSQWGSLPSRNGLPGSCPGPVGCVDPVGSLSAPSPQLPALPALWCRPALQAEFVGLDEGIGNIQGGEGKSEAGN